MSGPSRRSFLAATAAIALGPSITTAADANLSRHARQALDRATAFFRATAVHGGFAWSTAADGADRRGESKVTDTQIWVQPPGTPAIGQTFLRCFEVTRDPAHLEAARAAADALAYGQLDSGGWQYLIDFDPAADKHLRRALAPTLAPAQKAKRRNVTTFDDNTTQACIGLLLAATQVIDPPDDPARAARVKSALDYALAGMLRAQYPNGAFPQGYLGVAHNPADHPSIPASLPKDWRDLPRIKDYWFHYTLNDHTHSDCVRTLLDAHRISKRPDLLEAARRGGDFLLRAQLPAPQPAWAQQYTPDMRPAWARKFEPPAVCSVESVGACRTLIDCYLATGDDKYLAPIPAAIAWLNKVRLPDGRHARFYELNTDKPLYMTKAYEVTYRDDDLPTHYGFKTSPPLEALEKRYQGVKAAGRDAWLKANAAAKKRSAAGMEASVREVINALDAKGRWLDASQRVTSQLFIRNVTMLCDYIAADV